MGRISELMLVREVENKHSDTGGLPSFSPTRWRTATNRRSRRVAVDWGASSCNRSVHLPRSLLRPIAVRSVDTRVPAWPRACIHTAREYRPRRRTAQTHNYCSTAVPDVSESPNYSYATTMIRLCFGMSRTIVRKLLLCTVLAVQSRLNTCYYS